MANPAGQHVQPQPAPLSWEFGGARTPDGATLIVLTVYTVGGQHTYFLDPATAKTLAAHLEQTASQATTGLILPNGPLPAAFG